MKATKILHKFLIWGTWCEYIATIHTLAATKEEAMERWEAAFTTEQKAGLHITVTNCTEMPYMEKFFKLGDDGEDYKHWSGGYNYNY